MKETIKACDAYLDGLVLAREILWSSDQNHFLSLLAYRLKDRYDINLWDLKSPVKGD